MVSVDLLSLLVVCVKGALAAQQYIALELLKLRGLSPRQAAVCVMDQDLQTKQLLLKSLRDAVAVSVKEQLGHKQGSAAADHVTTADVVTQAVVEDILRDTFPDMPFTIVGEEVAASGAERRQVERCVNVYYRALAAIPHQSELEAHVRGATTRVTAATWEEMRERVGVFIDPIDGTNCFIEGCWEVPLTLVGITLDGVPVAGVVNRVFRCNAAQLTGCSGNVSLSYVWNFGTAEPFIVHEGQRVRPARLSPTLPGAGSVLCVASSSTTDTEFFDSVFGKLHPIDVLKARGAGNKLMFLVASMLAASSSPKSCDVFISPENTIKTWDTCAPHAFVLALGGELYTLRGDVIRYQLRAGSRTSLPAGVLGVSRRSKLEVTRRLTWPTSSL